MTPLDAILAAEAATATIAAIAAIFYARHWSRVAARERRLTDQFCFDSYAFSRLWQDESAARRSRQEVSEPQPRDPETGRFVSRMAAALDDQVPF